MTNAGTNRNQSAVDTCQITIRINAGSENAGRNYLLLGSASGIAPGTQMPLVHVLLNWDAVTNLIYGALNTLYFDRFMGILDANGYATAVLRVDPQSNVLEDVPFNFSCLVGEPNRIDYASDPMYITMTAD